MKREKTIIMLLTVLALSLLGATSCDNSEDDRGTVDGDSDTDTDVDSRTDADADAYADSDADTDGDNEVTFSSIAAEEEGYWYSRYNLGSLVMRSGLGETFMPQMEMVQKMVQMADSNPDDGDTPTPPVNPALLKSVYASGDPHFIETFDVADLGTQRWDPASFDTTITTRALGWTIIKEVEWAKQFHNDDHFGTVDADFGAQWRFVGLVLAAEAKMQVMNAQQMLLNDDKFYADSDGTVDYQGQWVFLEGFRTGYRSYFRPSISSGQRRRQSPFL